MIEELYSDPRIAERHRAGPLRPYVDEFGTALRTQGYGHQCICLYVRTAGKFSRWMQRKGLSLEDVGEPHVVQFLQQRRRGKVRAWKRERDALHCLSAWLQRRGLLSPPPCPEPTALDLLVSSFATYLSAERCLTDATVKNYCPVVRLFLSERFDPDVLNMRELSAKNVYDFVARHAHDHCTKRTQLMLSALRSFLRFCHLKGLTAGTLAIHVPTVASWRLPDVPGYLTADEIEKVLDACDQCTSIGRRDFAILTLLARLGLRAGEIVALTLDDVLWESGEIIVHGKGRQRRRLPLTEDIGQAIASYIKTTRPRVESRRLFIRAMAPLRGLGSSATVSTIVEQATKRAGLNVPCGNGANLLRRSLATGMLHRGASLDDIGQILRHKNPSTTAIYTKVDLDGLRDVVLPWPRRTP